MDLRVLILGREPDKIPPKLFESLIFLFLTWLIMILLVFLHCSFGGKKKDELEGSHLHFPVLIPIVYWIQQSVKDGFTLLLMVAKEGRDYFTLVPCQSSCNLRYHHYPFDDFLGVMVLWAVVLSSASLLTCPWLRLESVIMK